MTYVGMIVCNTLLAVLQEQETIRTVHQCSYRNEQVVTLVQSLELCPLGRQVIKAFYITYFLRKTCGKLSLYRF